MPIPVALFQLLKQHMLLQQAQYVVARLVNRDTGENYNMVSVFSQKKTVIRKTGDVLCVKKWDVSP